MSDIQFVIFLRRSKAQKNGLGICLLLWSAQDLFQGTEELHFAFPYGEWIWEQGRSIMHPSPSCPLYHARVRLINQTWPGYSSAKISSIAPVSYCKTWLTRLSMPTPPAIRSQQANSSQAKLLVIPPKAASYLYAIAHADCSARNALFYLYILSGGGGGGEAAGKYLFTF